MDSDSEHSSPSTPPSPKKRTPIDIQNEELFPALPSAAPRKQQQQPLGSYNKNQGSSNGKRNGSPSRKGNSPVRRSSPSRKPAAVIPPSTVQEIVDIPPNLQLEKPTVLGGKSNASEIVKNVISHTSTHIELSMTRKTGVMTFLIRGKPEDVKRARREVLSSFCIQVTETIAVPSSCRPHIVGTGGRVLKGITAASGAKISIPRTKNANQGDENEESSKNQDDDDEEQIVTIIGDPEGVELAKKEIQAIVSSRTLNTVNKIRVSRSYHPFVAAQIPTFQAEHNVQVHIPPPNMGDVKDKSDLEEIKVVGDREATKLVCEKIQAIHDHIKRTTRTLIVTVRKRAHRYVCGPKGAHLQEIFNNTGCAIELPPHTDPSDTVLIRGPQDKLPLALGIVLEKANSIAIEEVPLTFTPPECNLNLFIRFVILAHRQHLRHLEQQHNVQIIAPQLSKSSAAANTSPSSSPTRDSKPLAFEIQGKSAPDVATCKTELLKWLKMLSDTHYFATSRIRKDLAKYVIGVGGAQIEKFKALPQWEGKIVDVYIGIYNEDDDNDDDLDEEEEDVLIIVKRLSFKNQKDADGFVETIVKEMIADAEKTAELETRVVPLEHKWHSKLKSKQGGNQGKPVIHELTEGSNVVIKLPPFDYKPGGTTTTTVSIGNSTASLNRPTNADSDDIIIFRGRPKDIDRCVEKLNEYIELWKHTEVMASFSEIMTVPRPATRKLFGTGSGNVSLNGMTWLIRALKEKLDSLPTATHRDLTKGLSERDLAAKDLNMRIRITSASTSNASDLQDQVTIYGPQKLVGMAREIIEDRAKTIAETANITIDLFEAVIERTPACRASIEKALAAANGMELDELKRRIIPRVIGREGRNVRKLEDKFGAKINFPKGAKKNENEEQTDAATDTATPPPTASTRREDKGVVNIRCAKTDIEALRKELLDLVEAEIMSSFSVKFSVPRNTIQTIVGTKGFNINKIKSKCNVQVQFIDSESALNDDDLVETVVEGPQKGCEEAKELILAVVSDIVDTVLVTHKVPSYLHKLIIGRAGTRIKVVVDKYGGPDKCRIQFQPYNMQQDDIQIRANKKLIPSIIADIEAIAKEVAIGSHAAQQESAEILESECSLPRGDVPRVIGRGGEGLRELQKKFGVQVIVPNFEESLPDDASVTVKVVGGVQSSIDACIEEILLKQRVHQRVDFPTSISAFLHAPEPAVVEVMVQNIQDLVRKFKSEQSVFSTVQTGKKAGETEGIMLSGEKGGVESAVKDIANGLKEFDVEPNFEVLSIEEHVRPHIIGKGGYTIHKLREECGCLIDLVRKKDDGKTDTVVLRGSKDSVEKARQRISSIVRDQEKFQARSRSASVSSSTQETEASRSSLDGSQTSSGASAGDNHSRIPGYSGLKAVMPSKRRKGRNSLLDMGSSNSSLDSLGSRTYAWVDSLVSDNSWHTVTAKKSGRSNPTSAAASNDDIPVGSTSAAAPQQETATPGSSEMKKKKKKNKSKLVESEVAVDSASTFTATLPPPNGAAPLFSIPPVLPTFLATPSDTASPFLTPTSTSTSTTSTLLPTIVPAPIPAPIVSPKATSTTTAEDEWVRVGGETTVTKPKSNKAKSTQPPAVTGLSGLARGGSFDELLNAGDEGSDMVSSSSSKKKKNKKKKKATGAGGGNDDDDGNTQNAN